MPLSILRFKQQIPWRVVQLLTIALVTWTLSVFYTFRLNPEVRYFRAAAAIKRAWGAKMNREHGYKVIFFGGSSCGTSIDPERMMRLHKVPAANLGLGAGMGAKVLMRHALSVVRSNDVLIVMLEPGLLLGSLDPPSFGIQFSLAEGHPEWLNEISGSRDFSPAMAAANLRPGGRHAFTLLGKLISGKPLYRYDISEVHPSGWHEVRVRMPVPPIEPPTEAMSSDGRALLVALRDWCHAHRVAIYYSLPWGYVPLEHQAFAQQANARFLRDVAGVLPVLKDPRLGVYTRVEHFADTSWHPRREAVELRSDEVAAQIKSHQFWTHEELERLSGTHP